MLAKISRTSEIDTTIQQSVSRFQRSIRYFSTSPDILSQQNMLKCLLMIGYFGRGLCLNTRSEFNICKPKTKQFYKVLLLIGSLLGIWLSPSALYSILRQSAVIRLIISLNREPAVILRS
jgi:hypothetical protein